MYDLIVISSVYRLSNAFSDNSFSITLSLAGREAAVLYSIYEGGSLPVDIRNLLSGSVGQMGNLEAFLASNFCWYLVSPAVRNAVQNASLTGVDFVNIGLGSIHQCLEGYALMRPQTCLDLVDDEHSDIVWVEVTGQRMVERWYRLLLDQSKLEAAGSLPDFFALKEFPFFGIASQKLADVLAGGQFSGYSVKNLPFQT